MRAPFGFVAAAVVATSLAFLASNATGCGPSCQPSEIAYTQGTVVRNGGVAVYESSPPEGPFIPFNGNAVVRIQHGLGRRPQSVQIHLSFTERPHVTGGGGFSQAAGNQAINFEQTDTTIAIRNDSCANYYARIVALAVDDGDAGADASAEAAAPDAGTDESGSPNDGATDGTNDGAGDDAGETG